ncbi:MAG: helix-turn-helix transcriptional regulator [Ilumatobacteraceae bacterium]
MLLADALAGEDAPAPFVAAIEDFVAQSVTLIDADPTENWTVERLASACAVSPSWLCERFRVALGTTPMRYLFDRRMTLAADLLLHTSDSVERIGHDVGFANQPAFTRAFKRHFGSPPSEWRTLSHETADRRARALRGV